MLNKTVFCSSPWLHFRIDHSGKFFQCCWWEKAGGHNLNPECNIRTMSLLDYMNSEPMVKLRNDLLTGHPASNCANCYYQDTLGKLSGRKKRLHRSDIDPDGNFDDDVASSKHLTHFEFSKNNIGRTTLQPIDLQIDLSTVCNCACVMCVPNNSTKLVTDFKKMSISNPRQFVPTNRVNSWSEDPVVLDRFIDDLQKIPNFELAHFMGGETLIDPGFFRICERLLYSGFGQNIILSTTTGTTVYNDRIENIIRQSKGFHLGLSVETMTSLNDYIRYPTKIDGVVEVLRQFLELREDCPTFTAILRVTPSILTILQLDTVIQYMCDNDIVAESCNILNSPLCLRLELLPPDLKQLAIDKLQAVADKNGLVRMPTSKVTRDRSLNKQIISNVVYDYIDAISNMTEPEDAEQHRYDMVTYIQSFESLRGNCILDHAPELTNFLRQYGYNR